MENEDIVDKVKQHYDSLGEQWEARYEDPIRKKYFEKFEDKFILDFVNFEGKRILDIGTGTGRYPFKLSKVAKYIEGIDISESLIKVAKKKNTNSNVLFKVMDARNLEYELEFFDIVLAIGIFEYVHNLDPYLKEVYKVLKANGDFIFTCHNSETFLKGLSHKHFTKSYHSISTLKSVLEKCGFHIVDYKTTFFITLFQKAVILFPFIPKTVRKPFLMLSTRVNDFVCGHSFGRNAGKEIIVHAKKVRNE